MFELKMTTGNAAFFDDAGDTSDGFAKRVEVARILHHTIEQIRAGKTQGCCIDYNGNVVGEWIMK